MQTRTLIAVAVVLAAVAFTEGCGGGKGGMMGGMMEKFKQCDGETVNIDDHMKYMKECRGAAKGQQGQNTQSGDGEERRRRRGAGGGKRKGRRGKGMWNNMGMAVCMWKKDGMLDGDAKYSEDGMNALVDKTYPESKRADMKAKWKECADQHSSKFSDADNYASYKDFKQCTMKAHMDVCKIEMGGFFGGKGKGKKEDNQGDDN